MSPYVEEKMQECRRELDTLKGQLGMEKYQHIEELRRLKLEANKIRNKISELQRQAAKEKDPSKKARLLLLIEEEGKKLEANLKRQKEIPTSGINFDPSKYVSDMIDGIKRALERKTRGSSGGNNSGGGGGGNRKNPSDPDDPFSSYGNGNNDPDGSGSNRTPRNRRSEKDNQSNQQLIIFAVVALVIIFLLMNQKSNQSHRQYDEYDY